jgi:membrane protein involved in colicin uptake
MAANPDKEAKKAAAEASARDIYSRLMALKEGPDAPGSNNEWITKAGVNASFFTNIGAGKKSPSVSVVRTFGTTRGVN